jgi:hypothetical protein
MLRVRADLAIPRCSVAIGARRVPACDRIRNVALACSVRTYSSAGRRKRQRDNLPKSYLRHIRFSNDVLIIENCFSIQIIRHPEIQCHGIRSEIECRRYDLNAKTRCPRKRECASQETLEEFAAELRRSARREHAAPWGARLGLRCQHAPLI